MCCALYFGMGSQEMIGKIIAMWWPIAAFVAIGCKHSITDRFLIDILYVFLP